MSNKNGEEIKKNCLGRRLFLRLLIFCLSKQSDCFYFKHQLKQQKRRKGNMKNRIAILTLFQTNNSVNKYIKAKLHPLARKTNLLKCSKNFNAKSMNIINLMAVKLKNYLNFTLL